MDISGRGDVDAPGSWPDWCKGRRAVDVGNVPARNLLRRLCVCLRLVLIEYGVALRCHDARSPPLTADVTGDVHGLIQRRPLIHEVQVLRDHGCDDILIHLHAGDMSLCVSVLHEEL